MLVPCADERLPVRLIVKVSAARDLQNLNTIDGATGVFVDVHFAGQVFRTDACLGSTSPVWDCDKFIWETDEQQLLDNSIIFKVMSRSGTPYPLTSQIGRVIFDANPLVAKIRYQKSEPCSHEFSAWLPIYDMSSAESVPQGIEVDSVAGLIGDVMIATDPKYELFDSIRGTESSSEARLSTVQRNLRDMTKHLAQKAHSLGANAIFGCNVFMDVMGDARERIYFRAYGTAMSINEANSQKANESIPFPIVSLHTLPSFRFCGIGALISARNVHLIDEDNDSPASRANWWSKLKAELLTRAKGVGCNLIVGYTEHMSVHRRVAILSSMGTAVLTHTPEHAKEAPPCAAFHVSYSPDQIPFNAILIKCGICGTIHCREGLCPNLVVSNSPLPAASLIVGQQHPFQLCITKKVRPTENDEHLANEISRMLPYVEVDLHTELVRETQPPVPRGNAVFELRTMITITEGLLIANATAVVCWLRPLMAGIFILDLHILLLASQLLFKRDGGAEIANTAVASQRTTDSRRFSWGSVRDTMVPRDVPSSPSLRIRAIRLRIPAYGSANSGHSYLHPAKHVMDRFEKKTSAQDQFAKLLLERRLSLRIGVLPESTTVGAIGTSLAGIHLIGTGNPFVVTGEVKNQRFITLGRYTNVLIGKAYKRVAKDIAELDAFLQRNVEGALLMARQHAQAIGACGLSEFRIPSVYLCACLEDSHVVILVSADIMLPAAEQRDA
uniref:C2 domain-containing protein n=1 Tax=Ascaris lumbricoides TaxID=6252 RepID=A0A9J2P4H9_ASCLU